MITWRRLRKAREVKADQLERLGEESRDSLAQATADLAHQRHKFDTEAAPLLGRFDRIIEDNALAEKMRRAFGGT